jgi:hypothetical protein
MFRSIVVLLVALTGFGLAADAGAEIFKGMPDVIVCEVSIPQQQRTGRFVFYLDAQEDGKVTRYTTLGAAPMQIRIGADGIVSNNKLRDCAGKSVRDLRESEQAFDID